MDKPAPATPEKMPLGYDHASAPPVPRSAPPKYQSNSGDVTIVVSTAFLKSKTGILKVIQMVFGLVTFSCVTVGKNSLWSNGGSMVWVMIASMTTFALTALLYVLHAFKITSKFPGKVPFKFIEFVYCTLSALCYLTCGIVCSIFNHITESDGYGYYGDYGHYYTYHKHYIPALIAASVFSFANMLLYGAEIYFRYIAWWRSEEGPYLCGKKPPFFSTSSGSSAAARAVTETLY